MTSIRSPLVDSTFDVVNWFLDRALNDGEYLQPQKLHRLMFLAQAYCAVAHNGRRLMPAVFVADAMGPLEPNVYRAFENERPWISEVKMSEAAKQVLDSIWRRFGAHSADHLSRAVRRHPPYVDAWTEGPRTVITEEAMVAFYGQFQAGKTPALRDDPGADDADAAPALETVLRPRVLRSHKGRPVNAMPWVPKARKDP
ncbi:Panacea domain-containing protein [Pararhodospirillum photometricum]|uniref:Uncharacterized protein n=1 Tax=Pararhodospirillum photometricum DSM 122 TaxID=1150469 RepID=H6SQ85_PARPM|nr:type II toxin-antitoxin system antitoxin SocA domain-containing protein [Pararhodospirillum photometricum]CCG09604.1 Putative uncharacterized protein [Pararhodospirillum photometricum DSM 122]